MLAGETFYCHNKENPAEKCFMKQELRQLTLICKSGLFGFVLSHKPEAFPGVLPSSERKLGAVVQRSCAPDISKQPREKKVLARRYPLWQDGSGLMSERMTIAIVQG